VSTKRPPSPRIAKRDSGNEPPPPPPSFPKSGGDTASGSAGAPVPISSGDSSSSTEFVGIPHAKLFDVTSLKDPASILPYAPFYHSPSSSSPSCFSSLVLDLFRTAFTYPSAFSSVFPLKTTDLDDSQRVKQLEIQMKVRLYQKLHASSPLPPSPPFFSLSLGS
jgi:hypothetical protein